MARINLLPWREELRKQQQKEYIAVLGMCAAFAAVVWFLINLQFNAMINYQESRNDYLDDEIEKLDKKIEEIRELERQKQRLIDRIKAIEELQSSRPLIVHMFDELVTMLPPGIYLTDINQTGNRIALNGVSQAYGAVTALINNIEESPWLNYPQATIPTLIESTEAGQRVYTFSMDIQLMDPTATTEEGD